MNFKDYDGAGKRAEEVKQWSSKIRLVKKINNQ